MRTIIKWAGFRGYACCFLLAGIFTVQANSGANARERGSVKSSLADALSAGEWKRVEQAVDRGLEWLATQQQADGSFAAPAAAQPAVTSLGVLAYLSRGHQPGLGPYGEALNRAIDFVIGCQDADGLFSHAAPSAPHVDKRPSHAASYNHAIAGLMLGEVFGVTDRERGGEIKEAIDKALLFTRALQTRPKTHGVDAGGWRYLYLRFNHAAADSDLSVTGWQLLFLRSAKNAEFDVPQEQIDEAVAYVERCFVPAQGVFNYALVGGGDMRSSRGMVGAGIVSLSMAGKHDTPMARTAGDWLLRHPFTRYGQLVGGRDRFFYSTYYCSQAMAQLGGEYWARLFPGLAKVLVESQTPSGGWPPEPGGGDALFGSAYTTALAVLSLTPAYQLLPLYQR